MASVLFNNADSITRAGLPAVQPVTMIARINIVAFGGAAVYDNYFGQSGGPVVACIDDTLLLGTDTNDYTGSTLANNTWYTIAWVRSGNNHTVYLDGVQDITATDADSSSTVIVGDFGNADAFGNFRLGFFKVWTAALSQAEVIAEARSRKPVRWANLFSWLPCFDASTATTDLSGVGGNYTVSNGALSDDALDPGVPWQRRGYLYLPVSGDEPAVTTFTPAHGASTVGQNQNLVVTFDVNVQAGSGNFVIKDLADGSTFESIDITNGSLVTFATNTLTVNPAGTLAKGKNYYIEIDDGAVENADDDTPWGGISGSSTWRFSVETDAPSG
jgi:hypothetical protein